MEKGTKMDDKDSNQDGMNFDDSFVDSMSWSKFLSIFLRLRFLIPFIVN